MKEDAKPLFNNKSRGEHAKGEQGIANTISGKHSPWFDGLGCNRQVKLRELINPLLIFSKETWQLIFYWQKKYRFLPNDVVMREISFDVIITNFVGRIVYDGKTIKRIIVIIPIHLFFNFTNHNFKVTLERSHIKL